MAVRHPISGHVFRVERDRGPLAPQVSEVLARLGRRDAWVGDDDLVFVGSTAVTSTAPLCDAATPGRSSVKYLHYAPREEDSALVAKAFSPERKLALAS
jgi:hypothetical protein